MGVDRSELESVRGGKPWCPYQRRLDRDATAWGAGSVLTCLVNMAPAAGVVGHAYGYVSMAPGDGLGFVKHHLAGGRPPRRAAARTFRPVRGGEDMRLTLQSRRVVHREPGVETGPLSGAKGLGMRTPGLREPSCALGRASGAWFTVNQRGF